MEGGPISVSVARLGPGDHEVVDLVELILPLGLLKQLREKYFRWTDPGLMVLYPHQWEHVFSFPSFVQLVEFFAKEGPAGFKSPVLMRQALWLPSFQGLIDIAVLLEQHEFLTSIITSCEPGVASRALCHLYINYEPVSWKIPSTLLSPISGNLNQSYHHPKQGKFPPPYHPYQESYINIMITLSRKIS